jgi:hypothetical protein
MSGSNLINQFSASFARPAGEMTPSVGQDTVKTTMESLRPPQGDLVKFADRLVDQARVQAADPRVSLPPWEEIAPAPPFPSDVGTAVPESFNAGGMLKTLVGLRGTLPTPLPRPASGEIPGEQHGEGRQIRNPRDQQSATPITIPGAGKQVGNPQDQQSATPITIPGAGKQVGNPQDQQSATPITIPGAGKQVGNPQDQQSATPITIPGAGKQVSNPQDQQSATPITIPGAGKQVSDPRDQQSDLPLPIPGPGAEIAAPLDRLIFMLEDLADLQQSFDTATGQHRSPLVR